MTSEDVLEMLDEQARMRRELEIELEAEGRSNEIINLTSYLNE